MRARHRVISIGLQMGLPLLGAAACSVPHREYGEPGASTSSGSTSNGATGSDSMGGGGAGEAGAGGAADADCGNNRVDAGEECDDGNAVTKACAYGLTSCTLCTSACQLGPGSTAYCGDSTVNVANGEACDDGNTSELDACSNTCRTCAGITGLPQTALATNPTWINSGLSFTATANATLHQFTFNHQGLADTITLASSTGTVIGTIPVAAGSISPLIVNVDWTLNVGTAYRLTSATPNNQYFANAPAGTFPMAAAGGIRVDSSWCPAVPTNNANYWISFTNLKSCVR